MKYIFSFLLIFSIASSCNDDDIEDVFCTDIYVYGLNVTVRDASNNEILKEGITVIAKEGFYTEELMVTDSQDNFFGAGERQGIYIITVTGEGYETFVSETITVSGDVCHVFPESSEVFLVPN